MSPSRLILAALAAALIAGAAAAQQLPAAPGRSGQGQADRFRYDQPGAPGDGADQARDPRDPDGLMRRVLPFLDGQVMRYYDGEGNLDGSARRRGLTIRFYDADDNFVGRAERVSERVTRYYDADGAYIGRRIGQKLSVARRAGIDDSADFHPAAPFGPPGE